MPATPRTWQFIGEDEPDPAQRTKREQTSGEKLNRQQLKEKGDSCMRCCLERKICDLRDRCWKCERPQTQPSHVTEGTFCFRNIEQLWLWKATQQNSLKVGSRHEALFIARTTTFDDSSKQLRALPRLGQDLHDDNIFPMVFFTSKLGNTSATSRIAVTSNHLAVMLQPMPDSLRKQVKSALSDHIPDAVLPDLHDNSSHEERSLLASAQSAFRIHTFLTNATRIRYHASPRSITSAREVCCFLLECCARILAHETEEVLNGIRTRVRRFKRPGLVTKHAFGLYYTILSGLQQWKTESVFDIIMEPLISRAQEVMDDLGTLYQNIYGSTENLQAFVNVSIPVTLELDNLHVSHELLSAVDNTVKAWDPSVNDPFRKDFSLFLPDLLVLDGRVTWASKVQYVQLGVLSPQKVTAVDTVSPERERLGASESGRSQILYASQDRTLLNSPWDDRSTCVQSPSDVGHAADGSDGNRAEPGDVKRPLDLVEIHTGNIGRDHKRELSPVSSDSSRRSPTPKRSELDTWQRCLENRDNHFNEVYSDIMASRQTPNLQTSPPTC